MNSTIKLLQKRIELINSELLNLEVIINNPELPSDYIFATNAKDNLNTEKSQHQKAIQILLKNE